MHGQRLIDANALRDVWAEKRMNNPYFIRFDTDDVIESIDVAPTVDAKPVEHGAWIAVRFPYGWLCSRCGAPDVIQGKYCHNCGARMDLGEDDGK